MGEETQPIAGLHRDIEELPHAELLTALHENHDEQHLWDCIVAFEGYPFQTISGLAVFLSTENRTKRRADEGALD